MNYTFICVRCCKIRSSITCPCGGECLNIGRTQFQVLVAKAISKARKRTKNTRKVKHKVIKTVKKGIVKGTFYKSDYVNDIISSLQKGKTR